MARCMASGRLGPPAWRPRLRLTPASPGTHRAGGGVARAMKPWRVNIFPIEPIFHILYTFPNPEIPAAATGLLGSFAGDVDAPHFAREWTVNPYFPRVDTEAARGVGMPPEGSAPFGQSKRRARCLPEHLQLGPPRDRLALTSALRCLVHRQTDQPPAIRRLRRKRAMPMEGIPLRQPDVQQGSCAGLSEPWPPRRGAARQERRQQPAPQLPRSPRA